MLNSQHFRGRISSLKRDLHLSVCLEISDSDTYLEEIRPVAGYYRG